MKYDPVQLRELILEQHGDVRTIAGMVGADSEELRQFIMQTPRLRRALDEVIARGVDQSISVLFAGLEADSYLHRLAAAKEFMKSRPAQRRGFRAQADLELKVAPGAGALTLTWLPPEGKKAVEGPLIEGKADEVD